MNVLEDALRSEIEAKLEAQGGGWQYLSERVRQDILDGYIRILAKRFVETFLVDRFVK